MDIKIHLTLSQIVNTIIKNSKALDSRLSINKFEKALQIKLPTLENEIKKINMTELYIKNRKIGINNKPYFIADIAANHDGSLNRAKDLI